jgi:putative flippase GtrA
MIKDILAQFTGRRHGPLVQFIKYAMAGGVATVVHISLFYLCAFKIFPALGPNDPLLRVMHASAVSLSDATRARNSMIDNVIAFLFSNLTAYLINITWVFESGRHSRIVEIGFFYLVSGISLVIGSVLMGMLIDRLGIATTLAFGSNMITALVFNYVLRKFLIFKG